MSASLEDLNGRKGLGAKVIERKAFSGLQLGDLPPMEAWTPANRENRRVSKDGEVRHSRDGSVQKVSEVPPTPSASHQTMQPFSYSNRYDVSFNFGGDDHQAIRTYWEGLVTSQTFDCIIGILVFVNAVIIGIQVDHAARNRTDSIPAPIRVCETLFCVIFTIEIMMRICILQKRYFYRRGKWNLWNIADFVFVLSQVTEEIITIAFEEEETFRVNWSYMRCIRVLRFIRTLRSARIVPLIKSLRTLVASIQSAASSLVWVVALLGLVVYIFSIWLTQIVADFQVQNEGNEYSEALRLYYGSLGSTMLSLYQSVTGGLDWKDAIEPLSDGISPLLALVFCMYIAFVVLAMLNIVTGVFVHSAMSDEKESTDIFMKQNICQLFGAGPDDNGNDGVSNQALRLEDFESKLDDKIMLEYFRAIDVDPSEAKGVFELLDLDGSGSVDADEFLSGCLRLRGPAKALELELVMNEVRAVHKEVLLFANSFDSLVNQARPSVSAASVDASSPNQMFPHDVLATALLQIPQGAANATTLRDSAALGATSVSTSATQHESC
jgi:hypothetical protein